MFESFQLLRGMGSVENSSQGLTLSAAPETNFFNHPETQEREGNAPVFGRLLTGDFVFRARVTVTFQTIYDAGALFAYLDDDNWVKFAFEKTDLGTDNVISIVTKELSDDVNSAVIEQNNLYLQFARKGSAIALHFSLNGQHYQMVRLSSFTDRPLHVGLLAQSPCGKGIDVHFDQISLLKKTVINLRDGY